MHTNALLAVATATALAGMGPVALADTADVSEPREVPVGSGESPERVPELPADRPYDAGPAASSAQAGDEALVGTFAITAGTCESGPVTSGSYFRMVTAGGTPESGPYVSNGDSPCGDESYTPLAPGTDGGLVTGSYQPHPEPAFDDDGNALAARLTQPEAFFGTEFSTATNPVDPQTGTDVPHPEVTHDGSGNLGGDLRAFAAAWNNQHFNQGAPKPDGSRPGNTRGPTGTYDPNTGAFTLEWTSLIRGGPFDGFTGVWHLEGTFEPAEDASTGAADDGPSDGPRDEDDVTVSGRGPTPQTGPAVPGLVGLVALVGAWQLQRHRRTSSRRAQA